MEKLKPISKIRNKLIKLFNFNKQNKIKNKKLAQIIAHPQVILSVYRSLEKNKNFTLSKKNLIEIENLSNKLKKGEYFWQKNFLNLKNKIFTKLIKLVLITIYEPEFETLNYNFGRRPKKSAQTALKSLNTQTLDTKLRALEGHIQKTNANKINPLIMMKILRKKISDPKFLALVRIILKNQEQLLNNPINSLLFNIYLHEFDLYISKKIKKLNVPNQIRNQNGIIQTKLYLNNTISKLKTKQKIALIKTKVVKLNIKNFKNIKNKLKKYKQKQIKFKINHKKSIKQIVYNRYYKNWIIITNLNTNKTKKLKKELLLWLKNNLKFKWYSKKVIFKNLEKNKLKYLGFSLSLMIFKARQIKYRNKVSARRKIVNSLFIDIDHNYLKNKLFKIKMIKSNNKPRHIPRYCSLKPSEILKKFYQKLKALFKYYYNIISIPSNLSYYYYAHKFSCLKTLAYQMKKNIKYAFTFYTNKQKTFTSFFYYKYFIAELKSLFLKKANFSLITIDSLLSQENVK